MVLEKRNTDTVRNTQGIAHSITSLNIGEKITPIAFTFRKTKHDENALLVLREEDQTLYYGGAYFTFIYNKYKHIFKQYKTNVYGLINFIPILIV